MMTVKQVSDLTGVSVRTLQFYDEIGLLTPTEITNAGYRLYDEAALASLQQILFFKELDFTLKEIKTILDDPGFDRQAAFKKQRELLGLKRDRLTALLGLLDKLIKGERCMDFKDFDMSEYFRALNVFKETHTDAIVQQFGSLEQFDQVVAGMKSSEEKLAESAVKIYGSVENYTKAMVRNLTRALTDGPAFSQEELPGLLERTEALTRALTADLSRDPASPEVRGEAGELVAFVNFCNGGADIGEHYWSCLAENYLSSPAIIQITDKKYGPGASRFIGRALQAYLGEA